MNQNEEIFKIFLVNAPQPVYVKSSTMDENLDPNFMYEQYLLQQKQRSSKKKKNKH